MSRASRRKIARDLERMSNKDRAALSQVAKTMLPVHIQDQLDAASADLERRLTVGAKDAGFNSGGRALPGPRLQVKLDWLLAGLISGEVKRCEHLGDRVSPRPVVYMLWQDRVHCGCESARTSEVEDMTCDVCRTYHAEDCRAHILAVGPIIVGFGLCSECERTEMIHV